MPESSCTATSPPRPVPTSTRPVSASRAPPKAAMQRRSGGAWRHALALVPPRGRGGADVSRRHVAKDCAKLGGGMVMSAARLRILGSQPASCFVLWHCHVLRCRAELDGALAGAQREGRRACGRSTTGAIGHGDIGRAPLVHSPKPLAESGDSARLPRISTPDPRHRSTSAS